jgi:hypothetical protein
MTINPLALMAVANTNIKSSEQDILMRKLSGLLEYVK